MDIKYEVKEEGEIRRELAIEVDAATVGAELEKVLREVSRGARLPGFRQGKVPLPLLRRRYAREIEGEVLDHLVPHALGDAVGRAGLQPVHRPVIREVKLEDGQPLTFVASFEIRPKIEPRDYRGVSLTEVVAEVGDDHVGRELEAMREAAAQYEPVEPRGVERGDYALVDIRSVAEEGGEPAHHPGVLVEVGGEAYHPEFTNSILGMAPGEERSFRVAYGQDDPDPEARGKTVAYQVRMQEVKRRVLPALDDEFAKDMGTHGSLAELKQAIRADLQSRFDRERRRELERQLIEALTPTVTGEVPQALVEHEVDRMVEDWARMMVMRGVDPRTAPIDWRATREKMRERAVKQVRWELLLEAIADKENIEASPAEVEARLARIAEGSKKSLEFVRSKIEKEGRMEEVRASVRLEKAIDFVVSNAKMERR